MRVAQLALLALGVAGSLATPAQAVPMLQTHPTLSGVVAVGSTVTCVPGQWTGNGPLTKSYRWVIDGRGPDPYVGNGLTYEPVPADEGWPLQCEETVTDADDTTAQNTQAQLVLGPQPLANATSPFYRGGVSVGETMTCHPGTWSRTATFTYEWLRGGTPIPGATTDTYVLTAADAGDAGVSCRVTATAVVGGQTATASTAVAFVPRPPAPPREIPQPGKPTITGDARITGLLRCNPAAGSEEYRHEWKYASGASLEPKVLGFDLVVPYPAGGQSLICVASISNIDGYREARSDAVAIPALRRPSGIADFPVFEQPPLERYLAANQTAKLVPGAFGWKSPAVIKAPPGDVRVNGIEVTQATQYRLSAFAWSGLPNRCQSDPVPWVASICPPGEPVRYAGVKLVAGRPATARVFIDRAGVRRTTPVLARITVRTATGAMIGSMVQTLPLSTSVPADSPRVVTDAQRASAASSANFTIPGSYIGEGGATFEAEVVPQEEACPSGACTANNRFVLVGVTPIDTGVLKVGTVRVRFDPAPPTDNMVTSTEASTATFNGSPMAASRVLLPVRAVEVREEFDALVVDTRPCDAVWNNPGPIGVAAKKDPLYLLSCRGLLGKAAVDRLAAQNPGWRGARRYDTLVGLAQSKGSYARGWGSWTTNLASVPFRGFSGPTMISEVSQPIRWIAHELGHNSGLPHAGLRCNAGENAEDWQPDNEGRLQGYGWDAGRVPYDYPLNPGAPFYDLMSYCGSGGEGDAWVSPKNWDRMVDTFVAMKRRSLLPEPPPGLPFAARAQAGGPAVGDHLFVTAFAGGGAATINRVELGPVRSVNGTSTGWLVRALDGAGTVLAQAEALAIPSGEGPPLPVALIQAQLPPAAAGAARVEVVAKDGGAPAGGADRPAELPPVTGVRAEPQGGSGAVAVRWRAPQATTADVLVSVDGGKSWRTAWSGPATKSRVVLGAGQVPRSPRAKVRVRASDGWNSRTADSASFKAVGAAPQLTLLGPAGRTTIGQGEALALQATAVDDAGRSLAKGAITWLDGGRRVATGESAAATGLRPGRHAFEVVARDRVGRTTSAKFSVRVKAAPPTFTALVVPPTAPTGARTVRVRVAASRAAELRVAGQRFAVGPKAKTVAVRLPQSGTGEVVLRLELRADGRTSRVEAAVTRG